MPTLKTTATALATLLLLGGCASEPMGPTIAVMPAPNKPFEVFQQDQAVCQQYASQLVAGQAQQAANQQVLTGVAGTVLGAGLGAAIGGGRGAAIGAASGAVAGTLYGLGPAQQAQMSMQQRYDYAYAQCMYGRGNQVPGFAPAYPPPPPPPPQR
jgi:outer membrane lipoprotein SlyB